MSVFIFGGKYFFCFFVYLGGSFVVYNYVLLLESCFFLLVFNSYCCYLVYFLVIVKIMGIIFGFSGYILK